MTVGQHPLTGRKQSLEHIAKRVAAIKARGPQKRAPLSPETKAKISVAHKRLNQSEEFRAKRRAIGISAETREKMAESLRGRPRSPETKAKLSIAHTGRKLPPEQVAKTAIGNTGKKRTPEQCARQGERISREFAEGRRTVHKAYRYTTLAQALHQHLSGLGLSLEPEQRFGRFTVDLYDSEHHVAYEADGEYWHAKNERRNPGASARRDEYLRSEYGLRVAHFTEAEIKVLTGWPRRMAFRSMVA